MHDLKQNGSIGLFVLILFFASFVVVIEFVCSICPPLSLASVEDFNTSSHKKRVLRVVMDDNYPPYVFRDSSGAIEGILPDQWRLWQNQTGIQVKIIAIDWARAQEIMEQGRADVIDTIFYTDDRSRIYDFTEPYADIPVSIFFDKSISSIPDTMALRGFAVAVKKGDACINILKEKGVLSLIPYPSYEAIMRNAAGGSVKVFCMDDPPALYFLRKYKVAHRFRRGFRLYTGQLHRAVKKGHKELIQQIEKGFASIPKDELQAINNRWLGTPLGEPFYYRHIMLVVLVCAFLVAIVLAWNLSLKKLVRQKTKDLVKLLAETREKEELLRETKERLELALDGAALGAWDWDIPGKRVVRNRRWAEMLGYDPEKAASDPGIWVKSLHPEDRQRVLNSVKEHLSGETPFYEEEYRLRSASGRWVWVLDRGKVITKDSTGKPVRMAGVDIDITKRKRMEMTLRLLNEAVEQSPTSIMITDPSGTIEYVNPKFCELTGYDTTEVIGLNPRILKSGKTSRSVYEELWTTITSGKQWHGVLCNRKKNGELYWENTLICPILDDKRGITHFLAVKEDITEKRMLEDQLSQAQKLESIGRLAGGIAHDFSNVLSIITGNTQLIMMDLEKGSPIYQSCEDILEAATRSKNLIRQLMAFARKQTASPKVLDLNEIIRESEKMLKRLIGEDIELRFVPGRDLWKVKIDPIQLDQVLANLAVNARDAIPDVGTITIKTENVVLGSKHSGLYGDFKPGEYVTVVFSDTGVGMNKETLDHIFEPFFTTKEVGKGTGLGLSTVYGIVKQNDGFIHSMSKPGQGTTFTIYLPKCRGDVTRHSQPANNKLIGGKGTILVVDDDRPILEVCKKVLGKLGYEVVTASTPGEAISICRKEQRDFQLLLTDVVMPTMNGRELKERIEEIRSGIKTLFMSGYTGDIIANRGILAEGINYIEKPFSAEDLAEKVRKVLSS